MAQQDLIIGAADAKQGDTYFDAFTKTQANFTELYDLHKDNNIVEITEEADFPIQDGGTITLESGFGYWIKKPFTTAKRFIGEGGAIFSIVTDIPFITYTGTGSMFTATDNRMRFDNIVLSCPNAIIMEVIGDGTAGLTALAVVSGMVCISCQGIFKGVNGGLVSINNSSFICPSVGPAIQQLGPLCAIMSIERVRISGLLAGGTGIDLGVTVFNEVEINDNTIAGDATVTALSGASSSANLVTNGILSVTGCDYSAFTTPLSGIQENDIRVSFGINNSANLAISRNAADLFLIGGTETITTGLAGDWQEIGVPSSGGVSWDNDIADRFQISSSGVITYIGEREINVIISGRATVEKVGGGSDILEVRVALNWDGSASDSGLAKSRAQTQNVSPTSVSVGALTNLVQNDNIRFIFSNLDSTSDINAMVSSLEVRD